MEKISVVVPVYNVENYIDECIDSIVNQTYTNIEIIIVDDGSTDNSLNLCKKWAEKDNRIKVIHKENGGLSDARNVGITYCTGKYISFIDSDDIIDKELYKIAIDSMNNNFAQIFICGRFYLYGSKKKVQQKQNVKLIMNSQEALDKMNCFSYYDVAACDKVYEKSLFDGIVFPVGKLSEDWYTIYQVISKADKIIYDSTPLYIYRQRAFSITHSDNVRINEDCIEASKIVLEFIEKSYPDIKKNALTKYVFSVIGVYNNYVLYRPKQKNKINEFLGIIKQHYKIVAKNRDLTLSRKLQLTMLVKFNYLYNKMIIVFKKYKSSKSK